MALQWILLASVVALEVAVIFLLTAPLPALGLRVKISSMLVLGPLLPLQGFALLLIADVYYRYEHQMNCESEICTVHERDRFAKSQYKVQRDALLAVTCVLLYWILYRYLRLAMYFDRNERSKRIAAKANTSRPLEKLASTAEEEEAKRRREAKAEPSKIE